MSADLKLWSKPAEEKHGLIQISTICGVLNHSLKDSQGQPALLLWETKY